MSKQNKKWVLFSPEQCTSLPFFVRSMGTYDVQSGWQEIEKTMPCTQMIWCVSGSLIVSCGGTQQQIKAGECMYICYGEQQLIYCEETSLSHWVAFQDDNIESLLQNFGHPQKPWRIGSFNIALFERIAQELKRGTPLGQRLAAAVAFQLIAQSCEYTEKTNETVSLVLSIIHNEYHNPNINTSYLAKQAKVHRTRLSQLFHKSQGITLIDYLINYRIQQAITLLTTSNRSISDISKSVGYEDSKYFSRIVRKKTGYSPQKLRTTLLK